MACVRTHPLRLFAIDAWLQPLAISRPLATPMRFSELKLLSDHLASTLVVFDLKHTASSVESRGIAAFAAQEISKARKPARLDSPINPGDQAIWNPIAKGKLGFHTKELENAPYWRDQASEFVLTRQSMVWVGFNAKADATIIKKEHERLGLPPLAFGRLIDVMSIATEVTGEVKSLRDYLQDFCPRAVSRFNTAFDGVKMTAALLNSIAQDFPFEMWPDHWINK